MSLTLLTPALSRASSSRKISLAETGDSSSSPLEDTSLPAVIVIQHHDSSETDDGGSILRPKSSGALQTAISSRPGGRSFCGSTAYVCISRILFALTILVVLVIFILMMWYLIAQNSELHVLVWGIAGLFVAVTIPLSVHVMHLHCRYYVSPLQRQYVRIVFMPIIYSVESWLALRFLEQRIYLETIRDLYEAYVIYSFYHLMLEFLGGRKVLADRLVARRRATGQEVADHLPPLCCCRGWRLGSRFVHRNSLGVYQYIFTRIVVTIIMLIAEWNGVYKEGNFSVGYFYLYACIIINLSQLYALYCLALFYKELRKELAPLHPLGKFAIVKALVFITWWQSIGIAAAVRFHLVPQFGDYTSIEEIAFAMQDVLICVEMFLAAIGHAFFYSVSDFYSPLHGQVTPLALMQLQETQARVSAAAGGDEGLPTDSITIPSSASAPFSSSAAADGLDSTRKTKVASSSSSRSADSSSNSSRDSQSVASLTTATPRSLSMSSTASKFSVDVTASTPLPSGRQKKDSSPNSLSNLPMIDGLTPTDAFSPAVPPPLSSRTASRRGLFMDAAAVTPGGGEKDTAPPPPSPAPSGFLQAMKEIMPGDIIAETGEHLRSGFGLLHKWEKRKAETEAEKAEYEKYVKDLAEGRIGRKVAKSKFSVMDDTSSSPTPTSARFSSGTNEEVFLEAASSLYPSSSSSSSSSTTVHVTSAAATSGDDLAAEIFK